MLTPEQAHAELERIAVRDVEARRVRRCLLLVGDAAAAAQAFRGHNVPDLEKVGGRLDGLSARARRRVFRALHPGVGDVLDHAWQDLRRDPYTLGLERRAFRAPGHPEVTREGRATWVWRLLDAISEYEQPPQWFAVWAGRLGGDEAGLGRLLGVAIDHGHDDVFDALAATVRGGHDVAIMGRHVPVALLSCSRPDAWGMVERLLLSARRQEGLRQVILEAIDLAHPMAFRRMLALVVEHGLTRFAATVRAVGVWLGEPFDVTDRRMVDGILADLIGLLNDPTARMAALAGPDPGRVYLALWATAFGDAVEAAGHASKLLGHPSPEHRLAAARLLAAAGLPAFQDAILTALADDDLRVAAVGFHDLQSPYGYNQWLVAGGDAHVDSVGYDDRAFEGLRRLLNRLTGAQKVPVGLWKPQQLALAPKDVADTLALGLGKRPATTLADLVGRMSATGRFAYVTRLAKDPRRHRAALLDLVGDRSEWVRREALAALTGGPRLTVTEAGDLEHLLQRRDANLRRGVIALLLRQRDEAAVESVARLLAGTGTQVDGGRELARELRSAGRVNRRLRELPTGDDQSEDVGEGDGGRDAGPAVPDSLIDHDARTPPRQPAGELTALTRWSDGVTRVLTSFDAWLAEHRDVEVTVEGWSGPQVQVVSDLRWLNGPNAGEPWEDQRDRFPLSDLVQPWWERTAPQLAAGGLEAALAWPFLRAARQQLAGYRLGERNDPAWVRRLVETAGSVRVVRDMAYEPLVGGLLPWFAAHELRTDWIDPLLDGAEAALAHVPRRAIRALPMVATFRSSDGLGYRFEYDWRSGPASAWLKAAVELEALHPALWSPEQRDRLWRMVRFVDEPRGSYDPRSGARDHARDVIRGTADLPRRPARRRPPIQLAVRAAEDGVATRSDVADLLAGEYVPEDNVPGGFDHRHPLSELSRRRRPAWVAGYPWLGALVDEIRDRAVDAEAARGELPSPYSAVASRLRSVEGVDTVARLLSALGRQRFVRGYIWFGDTKAGSLSRLIRSCTPAEGETADDFAAAVAAHRVTERKLLELAVYAPQWAAFAEATLRYPGLTDAVYWLHAHTKDDQWQVDEDVRAEWAAEVHERTPLSANDLLDGAVDVAWLARVREALSDDRFDVLLDLAKYASSGGGHKRAQLYAEAVRGKVPRDELLGRIGAKRHQESVRALGLLPLPGGDQERRTDLLDRYQIFQEWLRQSRVFGQQRRASEELAARIGMQNLARTAGYRDPQRLMWAMEAEAVRDLAAGPVVVSAGDVTVGLSLDDGGAPTLEVRRAGKVLKNVPATLRKDEQIAGLRVRATSLRQQARRMRESLEVTSVRGHTFTVDELAELMAHPMLAPMLRDLLVVSEEGLCGFPRDGGRILIDHDGTEREADGSPMRVVHPTDLLSVGTWSAWQHRCFIRRIRQPFKQVFRELYVPTAAERDGVTASQRYAGHQVNPRQAVALLGSRGWVTAPDEGALRTFHDEGLTARLAVLDAMFTPAEAEGMTIETVSFTPVGQWEVVPLEAVPPRLFSEVMRDIDLVVSVAHAGGVDPEATASTVEMRGALVRETAELLGMGNVELTDHHALVAGKLGSYSVHLGSGVVHRRPGNALCIIPVGSQHRGRLFLPFVDDDPRTAEVVSKVVLLARDHQIKDPTILEQLRA